MNPMTPLLQTSLQDSNSTPPLNPLLCDQCQLWDDLERFEPARGSDRSLEERMKAQGCIMCDATVSLVNSRISKFESAEIRSWPPSRVSIRDQGPFFLDTGAYVEGIPAHRIDKSDPADQIIRLLVSLEVNFLPENEQNPTVKHERLALTPQFCLHYSGEPNSHLKSIEPWNVPYFDAPLLQKWIRGCEQAHKGLCDEGEDVKSNNLPRGFRVIDLREMKIVEPLDKVRFAALSYMWPTGKDNGAQLEKSNLKDFEAPGGVAKVSLPKLVTDAIALCKDLGEDFLWVDRICIVQDDATSKHSQIQGMDKIYQSASFCLVAALNARDGQGLPGFKNQPRMSASDFPPRECEIEGRGIKANGRETMVDTSLWNNRGWTFQERVLSRRCLFITDFQVIFECSRGQAFEELTYYPQQPLPAESNNEGLSPEFIEERKQERILEEKEHHLMPFFSKRPTYGGGINYNMNKSSTLVTYFEWVEDYTSRQLSFGSDILNAFAGVGNALADSLSSQMIFGLPEKYLPQALMWSTFGSATGRTETPDIPSWSWASCSNPIDYYWLKGSSTFKDDLLKIATIVEYFYQDPETGLRRLNVGERWIQHEIPLIEAVNGAQLPPLTGKYIPGDWRTHETWIQCPHGPFHTLACPDLNPDACNTAKTLPRSLVFNTTIASLRIGHHFKYTRQGQSPDIQDAAIFDPNGQHVGQIHGLLLDWINAQVASGRTHEFIVLCGALANWRERKTMAQYFGDFDMWRLHVMLVERSNSHSQAVRRVEVGYVFAHKWKDCNPQWDTVVLV